MLSQEEPDEQLPREEKHKAAARADRWLSKYERKSKFLNKMSEDYDVFDNVFDEFKKRMQYIAGDPRFSDIKLGSRSLIMTWARKEFKNMWTAHTVGVRVPLPIAVKKNVLVMEFVCNSEGNPAPALVNAEEITLNDYREVIEQMTMLYQKAKLVHADLSEYNIFKTDLGIMLFDFGSAVDIQHPNSKQFLLRDVLNINRFFERRGIEILNTAQVEEKIRGNKK
jgi:RIO kinase 1